MIMIIELKNANSKKHMYGLMGYIQNSQQTNG